MKTFAQILRIFFLASVLLVGGTMVHAQVTNTGSNETVTNTGGNETVTNTGSGETVTNTGLTNPLQVSSLQDLVSKVMSFVVQIGSIFLVFMLVYTGYKFVAARGNEEQLSNARSALLWTVIGGLLLLGAQALANAIAATIQSL